MSKLSLWIQNTCTDNKYEYKEKKNTTSLKRSMPKQIGKRKKLRLILEWSESELFIKRFNQLKSQWRNYCMVTGKLITEDMLSPASFPHILNKNMFKSLRYFTNNIWLVFWIEEHNIFDTWISNYKKYYWVDNLKTDIVCWKEVYVGILFYNKWIWTNIY